MTDAATGKPVPDVVVTATSPAVQGEEIVVTDAAGLYRIPQLPPGTFKLKLEKETYKLYTRGDINVRVDRTVRVNIQIQPEAVQGDTIVVVGKAPTVDVGSTATGVNVGKEFINNIAFLQPNGNGVRSFESLAAVAPQVTGDDFGYGFSGAQSPENLYLIDGVSVSDPSLGINGAQFPVEFVEEANVITGGYLAEYGRATGGVLNVVTKSGSNEFHGSVWGDWTPGLLSGIPKTISSDASSVVVAHRDWNTVDFGVEVGGPILKDKLWFYVGFSPSFSRTQRSVSLRRFLINDAKTDFLYDDNGFIKSEELAGTKRSGFDDNRSYSYIAKLTYLLNADNSLAFSVIGSPTTQVSPYTFGRSLGTAGNYTTGSSTPSNTTTVSLKYTGGFFDKHLLIDASAGWFHMDGATLPSDGSDFNSTTGGATVPGITFQREIIDPDPDAAVPGHSITAFEQLSAENAALCAQVGNGKQIVTVRGEQRFLMACPATGAGATYSIGGIAYMEQRALDRYQGKVAATYLMQGLGHHIFKAGLDIERLSFDLKKGYSGGVYLDENGSGTLLRDSRRFGYFTGPDEAIQQNYVHSVSTSTSVGAFIQDSWSIMDLVTLNAGLRYENQQLFAADGSMGMTLNNMLSPRVGVIYDFTQQGRSKFYANFARYYEAVPVDIADRSLTGENSYGFRHYIKPDANGNGGPGCNVLGPEGSLAQANDKNGCLDPRNNQDIYFGNNANVNQYGRLLGSGKVPVDPDLKPQSIDEFTLGGEYEIISDGRIGASYTRRYFNYVIEDMSLDEGSTFFIGNPGYGLAKQFPKATRDYDAVTLSFTKAFSEGWMAQASYTWSYLRGNNNGLYRPETAQIDPNNNSDFDLVSILKNRDGPLSADHTHFIKVYASKEFVVSGNLGFVLGLSYEGLSGAPINYLSAHPLYGADESFVLPRGAGGRLPWNHTINAKGGVTYKINKDNAVSFTVDVFNMLNFQAVTSVDETFSTKNLLPATVAAGANPAETICYGGDTSANPACADGNLGNVQKSDADTAEVLQAKVTDVNPNFKKPTSYQAPISVRFGIKLTF